MYAHIVTDLEQILGYLKSTPASVGDSRSLLDVTTVVVTSEFGRTMRQVGAAIDNTGTDHNTVGNVVLLAGKNLVGGQIIGASDQEAAGAAVSQAHRQLDPSLVKLMGRPFDFERMVVGKTPHLPGVNSGFCGGARVNVTMGGAKPFDPARTR